MKRSIQNLLEKLDASNNPGNQTGFYSIKGGTSLLQSNNSQKCNNQGDCKNSDNQGICTNALCDGSTNEPPNCTNTQSCFR